MSSEKQKENYKRWRIAHKSDLLEKERLRAKEYRVRNKERIKQRRIDNIEAVLVKEKAQREKYKENNILCSKRWEEANPNYRKQHRTTEKYKITAKNRRLKKAYGITLDEYNKLFAQQEGNCAICSKNQSELKNSLCVDHCHGTGKIRGLLCFDCNTAIGKLGDSLEKVKRAVLYLEGN